jgi:hypothetical protein
MKSQTRADPRIGPSDSSDTYSDRPDLSTDTDAGGTGERESVERVPDARDVKTDRVVEEKDAGLGGGLDQAEEARLGVTDEELRDSEPAKRRKP